MRLLHSGQNIRILSAFSRDEALRGAQIRPYGCSLFTTFFIKGFPTIRRMIEAFIAASCVAFILYLVPWRYRFFFGIVGWTSLVIVFIMQVPKYLAENNILYPVLAVLSLPFLYFTSRHLLEGNETIMGLTRAAAIAWVIYAPFQFIPLLGDALIGIVAAQVAWILAFFQVPVTMDSWNMIGRNNFRIEIILACTGIQSIAIMLGVACAVPTTWKQKIWAFLIIVPVIYGLNLLRNVWVYLAYTGQWFPYLPEIASNGEYGYESFFWAHNIIAEGLAVIVLVAIAFALFTVIPDLGEFAVRLYRLYEGDVRRIFGKGRESAG